MASKPDNGLSNFYAYIKGYENPESFNKLNTKQKKDLYEFCWNFISKRSVGKANLTITEIHGCLFLVLNMQDMPFIVDSVRMALSKLDIDVQSFINIADIPIERKNGKLVEFLAGYDMEAILIIELANVMERDYKRTIAAVEEVVADVMLAVEDWQPMQMKMNDCLTSINYFNDLPLTQEAKEFLQWLQEHFTFFGFRSYICKRANSKELELDNSSALGVLRAKYSNLAHYAPSAKVTQFSDGSLEKYIVVGKSKYRSTIHRPVYTDVIIVRIHNAAQKFVGEYRFFGLFTSNAYESDPMVIPFLKHKSNLILNKLIKQNIVSEGYTSKKIKQFIRSIPRDELFQADAEEVVEIIKNALALQNNSAIRVHVRHDKFRRFVTVLLYIPQNNHTHARCENIMKFLKDTYCSDDANYQTTQLDLHHLCVHFVLRTSDSTDKDIDSDYVKERVLLMSKTWHDLIRLHASNSEYADNVKKFKFSNNFKEQFTPEQAFLDLEYLSKLSDKDPIKLNIRLDAATGNVYIRTYQWKQSLNLSEALPIFENLGFELKHEAGASIVSSASVHWISEFTAKPIVSIADNNEFLEGIVNTFYRVLAQDASNDSFNQLGLRAGLEWFEIRVIRAIAHYLKQIGFSLSIDYMASTLNQYPIITKEIMQLFIVKFSPDIRESTRKSMYTKQLNKLLSEIESVMYVDEDKIYRAYISVISAVVRTNAYKINEQQKRLSYISLKIHSADVQEMPLPAPKFEIFTFSHRFMGIHLRADMVARGGLRWSDREDFRKEILDLMKAQQVKNSLIVPAGAKGGFVLRRNLSFMSVQEVQAEAIACYKLFISSLLDLTHNIVKGEIVAPAQIVCHDAEDYYLVVAADKGTSSFSDIANSISEKYNFWLKDAFATGGSKGYDHKKMGITSRGAWESVKWHFTELGERLGDKPFTVVGIGCMAGDVFGNGMLLSDQIKLVAAFNHKFIFLDPNPDTKKSFRERTRLFNMSDSMWSDYNQKLISKGGGVYSRFDKKIPLGPEACLALGINEIESATPSELIKIILKAQVDLIWNGGIGTYVKSSKETNLDVGDHANDKIRINGKDLRCRIFAEGGNLGMTQLSRAEAEFASVRLNTDFIDNSAGVDCSDHEVNIKILLNSLCDLGALNMKDRDSWLSKMTNEVAALVVANNKRQNLAISIAAGMLPENLHLFESFIDWAVNMNFLNREIEFLPSPEELKERVAIGKSFSRSELAILLSYSKIILQKQILASNFTDSESAQNYVYDAFPKSMIKLYDKQILTHSLRREIIATQVSSDFIQNLGITFIPEVISEMDVSVENILLAFLFVKEFYDYNSIIACLNRNEDKITHDVYMKIWQNLRMLMRRSTRWILRNKEINPADHTLLLQYLSEKKKINDILPKIAGGQPKKIYSKMIRTLSNFDINQADRESLARPLLDFSSLNIIDAAIKNNANVKDIAEVHFLIFDKMKTDLLRIATSYNNFSSRWSVISRFKVKGTIDALQRDLTGIFYINCFEKNIKSCLANIENRHKDLLQTWQKYSVLLQPDARLDFEVIFVMITELQKLKNDLSDYYERDKL